MFFKNPSSSADDRLVQSARIAEPCNVPWDTMTGDERIKFCGQCKLNVYNIAEMSTKEAAALIRQNEGKVCLKLYKRKDGTIITDNCPVGLRKMRNRLKKTAVAVLLAMAWIGLISDAHAQGLVGAPVDVRFGVSNSVGSQPSSVYDGPSSNFVLQVSTALSVAVVLILNLFKKTNVAFVGTALLAIWALAGILIGGFTWTY